MRGFLGTAAAMIFAFSLITAMYTFMLTDNDVAAPARVGVAVESARWAVEADVFNCSNPAYNGKTYNDATKAGVEVSRDRSNVTYSTGFMDMKVHLERDYAPSAKLESMPAMLGGLRWAGCDIEDSSPTCVLYNVSDGSSSKVDCISSKLGAHGKYYIKVTDARGNTGYSNTVIV